MMEARVCEGMIDSSGWIIYYDGHFVCTQGCFCLGDVDFAEAPGLSYGVCRPDPVIVMVCC
ncbi:MAG TPA: hypothetical protein DCZ69_11175 [Syntrophobacteraceae bacterium]|nr:hypothetical protein [Syntrophobacteraceae bacterium]HBD08812.1 hypothetical protein [Syntrophobacteraceae bacterium]HBZ56078.1 hypothetical protein [Syntrophobacteraceae bacterium]